MVLTKLRRETRIGERDWGKQPLFAPRRRRSFMRWFMLLVAGFVVAVFMIFPELVSALLAMVTV